MARSPRTESALLGVLLLACAPPPSGAVEPASAALAFAKRGESVAQVELDALRDRVAPQQVSVHDPYEDREIPFVALPFEAVLDAVYGDAWREEEELLFTCRDGYQPSVPVARVLAHRAWLAFARADQQAFTLRKHESGSVKEVELGPFYLVWSNLDDVQVRQEHDYGWPYQLVGVDRIRTADRFPRMIPPEGASEAARRGFAAFRVHCGKCHPLNGEGGSIGPELNAAAKPVRTRDPDWLRTWIVAPAKILPTARMEPLNPKLPDRERVVDDILAYLEAMAGGS